MKTISKKLLSLLLVVIMVASVIPFQAFATAPTCPSSEHDATNPAPELTVVEASGTDCKFYRCPGVGGSTHDFKYLEGGAVGDPIPHSDPAAHSTETIHHDKVDATCVAVGKEAYEECKICGAIVSGGAEIAIDPSAHNLVEQAQTDTTCKYWKCSLCGKKFSDAAGNNEITAVPTHADPDSDHYCDNPVDGVECGYYMPEATTENVANSFKVAIKYVNAKTGLIKRETVTPQKVVIDASGKIVEFQDTTGAFMLPDPAAKTLNFSVKNYFAAGRKDNNSIDVATTDETVYAVNFLEEGEKEITVNVTYVNPPTVTITFNVTANGKFTATANKDKAAVAEVVTYGESLPMAPIYEGKTSAHRALQKWASDAAGTTLYNYAAGSASQLTTSLNLYAMYDATPATNASMNICFYGTNVTSTIKTLNNLSSDATIDSILSKVEIDKLIDSFNYGYQPVSYTLYKNASGAVYAAGTTVADVNQGNGTVYINVKPLTYTATFQALDGTVNALIANGTIKKIENLRYGQTNIEMPIPVATGNGTSNYTFYGWREVGSGNIYKFVDNTKMLLTYSYNRDTTFEPVWNTSEGVYVNVYFNNITNRSLYTVQIHDLQAGDHLTANKVLNLLSQYFTWTDFRGLYTNTEWNQAVRNNFTTGSGNKSVDGVLITTEPRQEFNLMLLGAKQNGVTITKANLSVIGIGVNANGAYAPADPTNPKTGNEAEMLGVAMASMVMAVITLAGVTYYTRKKEEMI